MIRYLEILIRIAITIWKILMATITAAMVIITTLIMVAMALGVKMVVAEAAEVKVRHLNNSLIIYVCK